MDLLAEVGQTSGEVEGRVQRAAGDPAVGGAVPGLDVEQDQVGVAQQGVGGAVAEEARGVQGGVQAEFVLEAVQQLAREDGLEQRFSPLTVAPPPAAAMNRVYLPASATTSSAMVRLPSRIRQVSALWQYRQASGQPDRKVTNRVPGPSTPVDRSHEWTEPTTGRRVAAAAGVAAVVGAPPPVVGVVGADGRSVVIVLLPYSDPWKVRLMTSSCCSRVRRMKLTA